MTENTQNQTENAEVIERQASVEKQAETMQEAFSETDSISEVRNIRLFTVNQNRKSYFASAKPQGDKGYTIRQNRKAVARGLTKDQALQALKEIAFDYNLKTVNVEINSDVEEAKPIRLKDVQVPRNRGPKKNAVLQAAA